MSDRLADKKLPANMRNELKRFDEEQKHNKGIRLHTRFNYVCHLYYLGRYLVANGHTSYEQAIKDDILWKYHNWKW